MSSQFLILGTADACSPHPSCQPHAPPTDLRCRTAPWAQQPGTSPPWLQCPHQSHHICCGAQSDQSGCSKPPCPAFTSEGAHLILAHVLGRHLHAQGLQTKLHMTQVQSCRSNYHIHLVLVEFSFQASANLEGLHFQLPPTMGLRDTVDYWDGWDDYGTISLQLDPKICHAYHASASQDWRCPWSPTVTLRRGWFGYFGCRHQHSDSKVARSASWGYPDEAVVPPPEPAVDLMQGRLAVTKRKNTWKILEDCWRLVSLTYIMDDHIRITYHTNVYNITYVLHLSRVFSCSPCWFLFDHWSASKDYWIAWQLTLAQEH